MWEFLTKLMEELFKFLRHRNFLYLIGAWMFVQGIVNFKEVLDFIEAVKGFFQ